MRVHLTGFSVGVALLSCLVASTTHAQSEDEIETREVVVTSTRLPDTPVDARTLPAKVTVITAEDIQKSWRKERTRGDAVGNNASSCTIWSVMGFSKPSICEDLTDSRFLPRASLWTVNG